MFYKNNIKKYDESWVTISKFFRKLKSKILKKVFDKKSKQKIKIMVPIFDRQKCIQNIQCVSKC